MIFKTITTAIIMIIAKIIDIVVIIEIAIGTPIQDISPIMTKIVMKTDIVTTMIEIVMRIEKLTIMMIPTVTIMSRAMHINTKKKIEPMTLGIFTIMPQT